VNSQECVSRTDDGFERDQEVGVENLTHLALCVRSCVEQGQHDRRQGSARGHEPVSRDARRCLASSATRQSLRDHIC
jgi:hypothetical protein